jgi:glutamyl-tRNA synthetase
MSKIRVRFAPSPTGYLHIGGFRTALYNYLFAKKNNADFVLRIEDTDKKRFVKEALENLLKVLYLTDIIHYEGPFTEDLFRKLPELSPKTCADSTKYPGIKHVGEYGPYIQSERLEKYKQHAEELVKNGHAYYCFCEPERLEKMRETQKGNKQPPVYDRFCLKNLPENEINKKLKSQCSRTIRLKVPENKTIEFEDKVRGKVSFKSDLIDDQVLLKSDGYPTYHLANVVDDHEMEITHVIRGEEWLPSTPKHILLYQAFGWELPQFAHLPLLLNPDRSKLSKRQGDVAVEDYINKGYLKEAIINFVAFLGWNPGEGSTQEIFTLEELVEKFDLSRVHKAGAVFDIKKLDWMNSQWIKKITLDDLYTRALPYYKKFLETLPSPVQITGHPLPSTGEEDMKDFLKKVLTIEKERLEKLSEVGESNKFFFQDINFDKDLLRWKTMPDEETRASLEKSFDIISKIDENSWTVENLEKILMDAAGEKRGELLWPLRAALTGAQKSPSPFEVAWVLGKTETLARINQAITSLK